MLQLSDADLALEIAKLNISSFHAKMLSHFGPRSIVGKTIIRLYLEPGIKQALAKENVMEHPKKNKLPQHLTADFIRR